MDERQEQARPAPPPLEGWAPSAWRLVDNLAAYRLDVDPATGEPFIGGLVMFGPVTTDRLRGLRTRGMTAALPPINLPEGVTMPTEDHLVTLMAARASLGQEEGLSVVPLHRGRGDSRRLFAVLGKSGASTVVTWHPRGEVPTETTDEWYANTAALYRHVEAIHPASATKALGDYCEVPFTTAVRWVRQCRNRPAGLLPRSSKQLGKSKGKQKGVQA